MAKGKEIYVYAHWKGFKDPLLMGTLKAITGRGKESFSFEYNNAWLKSGFSQMIDPDLQMYSGAYYPIKYLATGIFEIGDLFKTNWNRTSSILILKGTPIILTFIASIIAYSKFRHSEFYFSPTILALPRPIFGILTLLDNA